MDKNRRYSRKTSSSSTLSYSDRFVIRKMIRRIYFSDSYAMRFLAVLK